MLLLGLSPPPFLLLHPPHFSSSFCLKNIRMQCSDAILETSFLFSDNLEFVISPPNSYLHYSNSHTTKLSFRWIVYVILWNFEFKICAIIVHLLKLCFFTCNEIIQIFQNLEVLASFCSLSIAFCFCFLRLCLFLFSVLVVWWVGGWVVV